MKKENDSSHPKISYETTHEKPTKKTKPIKKITNLPIKKIVLYSSILIIIITSLIILGMSLYSFQSCKTWDCFNQNLASCSKAKFAGGRDIIFGYTINGKTNDFCEVQVEYLQGEIANKDAEKLANEKMICFLPKGIVMLPETELNNCHGILKEKLQEQLISKLHNFILQNLGQINKELLNPLTFQTNQTEQ